MATTAFRNKVLIALSICLLALSLCILSGCGSSAAKYDVGQGKVMAQGKDLTVELQSNPTTGFEWTAEIEGTTVKAVSDSYQQNKSEKATNGAGGIHTFVFQGVGTGDSTITFKYARSWESGSPEKTITMDLTVTGDVIKKSTAKSSDGTMGGHSS